MSDQAKYEAKSICLGTITVFNGVKKVLILKINFKTSATRNLKFYTLILHTATKLERRLGRVVRVLDFIVEGHRFECFFFQVPFKIISLIETSQSIGGAKREYPGSQSIGGAKREYPGKTT